MSRLARPPGGRTPSLWGMTARATATTEDRPAISRDGDADDLICRRYAHGASTGGLAADDHAVDIERRSLREQAKPAHRVHHALKSHRIHPQREGRQRDEGRVILLDPQVVLDRGFHGGAVGVGDFLPLGQRRGERLQGVGILLGPRGRDRVALDREILGGPPVEVGEFGEA
jgi:hypothetical protein